MCLTCHFKQLQAITQQFISTNRQTSVLNKHSEAIKDYLLCLLLAGVSLKWTVRVMNKVLLTKNRQIYQYTERPEDIMVLLMVFTHTVLQKDI